MNFIDFESARSKERIREELRVAREAALQNAQKKAEKRNERALAKKLRGEHNWMLPSIAKKFSPSKSTKVKKKVRTKRSKKSKKDKKKKTKSNDSSDSEDEIREKKPKKEQCSSEDSRSDSNSVSESEEEEWVEKTPTKDVATTAVRDDWMTGGFLLPTYTKQNDSTKEKEKLSIDSYNPKTSTRELNPYWKDGGEGLPVFKKPKDDDRWSSRSSSSSKQNSYATGNWRKNPQPEDDDKKSRQTKREETITRTLNDDHRSKDSRRSNTVTKSDYEHSKSHKKDSGRSEDRKSVRDKKEEHTEPPKDNELGNFMTDQQMNELGAKIIKAEIMGNDELSKSLKDKLENARKVRNQIMEEGKQSFVKNRTAVVDKKQKPEEEHILLTRTDNTGASRPLSTRTAKPSDPWGGRKCKAKKVETHEMGERVRYFADDDRYDIKQMFEREKYTTSAEADAQFADIVSKHKDPNDNLEDIFDDKVRKNVSEPDEAAKEKARAINEHQNLTRALDNCDKCLESKKMEKQLMVSMGTTSYLSLPWHEGLQVGHCLIIPIQHISCSTQLDEDTWSEINDYRKALTRMFAAKKQDVIFFETARYLSRRPHMAIHCVASSRFEMAPFYFKKAIQESEYEWSTNKQLISLKDKDLRRAIPKGLPYFWVNFGMDSGFAHVIEDQERFPSNFAQEIIGGLLNLDPQAWRKPRKEYNSILKTKQFADWWKTVDFTN